jgi:hypothetical protein
VGEQAVCVGRAYTQSHRTIASRVTARSPILRTLERHGVAIFEVQARGVGHTAYETCVCRGQGLRRPGGCACIVNDKSASLRVHCHTEARVGRPIDLLGPHVITLGCPHLFCPCSWGRRVVGRHGRLRQAAQRFEGLRRENLLNARGELEGRDRRVHLHVRVGRLVVRTLQLRDQHRVVHNQLNRHLEGLGIRRCLRSLRRWVGASAHHVKAAETEKHEAPKRHRWGLCRERCVVTS